MPPFRQYTTGTVASGTSIVLTFNNPLNAQGSIFVCILQNSATDKLVSIVDNQGNNYLDITSSNSNGSNMLHQFRVAKSIVGGPTSITATFTTVTAVAIAFETNSVSSGKTTSTHQDTYASGSGTSSSVTTSSTALAESHEYQLLMVSNLSGATYTLGANQSAIIQVSDGALSAGLSFRITQAKGSYTAQMTVSANVALLYIAVYIFGTNPDVNNYKFVSVGDGMSTVEKVR